MTKEVIVFGPLCLFAVVMSAGFWWSSYQTYKESERAKKNDYPFYRG